MAQYARPSTDVTVGGWAPSSGSVLAACIDSTSEDNSDYITDNAIGYCETSLSELTDPVSASGHVVRYTYRRDRSDRTLTYRTGLYTSTGLIAQWSHVNPSTNFTLAQQTLTSTQADAIGNYASGLKLRYEITALQNNQVFGEVGWAEFEVPDAPTGVTYSTSVADGSLIGDLPASAAAAMGSLSDGALIGEAFTLSATAQAILTDGVLAGDTASGILMQSGSLTDGVLAGDTLTVEAEAEPSISDGVLVEDAPAGTATAAGAVTDGVLVGDASTATSAATESVTPSDGVKIDDVLAVTQALGITITDGVLADDILTGTTPSTAAGPMGQVVTYYYNHIR